MMARGFAALLGATAVGLVAATIVVATPPEAGNSNPLAGAALYPDLAGQSQIIRQVEIEKSNYDLTLLLRDGRWVAREMGDYPVKAELVTSLLASLEGLSRIEPKTANPAWYRYIGVGGADAEIGVRGTRIAVLGDEQRSLANLIVGKASSSVGYTQFGASFVRKADEEQSWLVEGNIVVPGAIGEWFAPLLSIPGVDIEAVSILAGEKLMVAIERTQANANAYAFSHLDEEVGPSDSPVNDELLRSLNQVIVSMAFEKARSRGSVDVATDARMVRFRTNRGVVLDATLADADGETWVLLKASEAEGLQAADEVTAINERVGNWAFALAERRTNLLKTDLSALIAEPEGDEVNAPGLPGSLPSQ